MCMWHCMSVALRMKCASAGLELHLWGQVSSLRLIWDCTFIFQSNNQTTSPFAGALPRGGGRPQSQTQSLMHLGPIYPTDVPLLCRWRQPGPVCLATVELKTKLDTGQRCAEGKHFFFFFFKSEVALNERYLNRHESLNTLLSGNSVLLM